MSPRIAYIVPAFNARRTLPDTLASITAQSISDIEAIVVDDGSTDGGADAARELGDRRVRVVRQSNRGLAAARNRGLGECRADAVCFLDADDVIDPGHAGAMLDALAGHDLAACWHRYVGPELEDLDWTMRVGDEDLTMHRLIEFNPLAVGAVAASRAGLARVGITTPWFDPALPCHEDWDLWLRATAGGARWASIVPRALFSYRLQPGSMSGALERMWRVGLGVIDRAPADAGLKPRARRRWTVRHLARAAARGDRALADRLRAELGAITPDDAELLGATLAWALRQEDRPVGEPDDATRGAWRRRLAACLGGIEVSGGIEGAIAQAGGTPDAAARRLRRLASGRTLVIYGMGRNGRALVESLSKGPEIALAWIDDAPGARAPEAFGRIPPRIGVEDLSSAHLVVATPSEPGTIAARAAARGARVARWAELVDGACPGEIIPGC